MSNSVIEATRGNLNERFVHIDPDKITQQIWQAAGPHVNQIPLSLLNNPALMERLGLRRHDGPYSSIFPSASLFTQNASCNGIPATDSVSASAILVLEKNKVGSKEPISPLRVFQHILTIPTGCSALDTFYSLTLTPGEEELKQQVSLDLLPYSANPTVTSVGLVREIGRTHGVGVCGLIVLQNNSNIAARLDPGLRSIAIVNNQAYLCNDEWMLVRPITAEEIQMLKALGLIIKPITEIDDQVVFNLDALNGRFFLSLGPLVADYMEPMFIKKDRDGQPRAGHIFNNQIVFSSFPQWILN